MSVLNSYIVSDVIYYCNRSVSHCSPLEDKDLSYYDFTFVLNGSMTYFVNDEKFTIENGDAIFLRPGDSRCRVEGKSPAHYISFNFLSDNEKTVEKMYQRGYKTPHIRLPTPTSRRAFPRKRKVPEHIKLYSP